MALAAGSKAAHEPGMPGAAVEQVIGSRRRVHVERVPVMRVGIIQRSRVIVVNRAERTAGRHVGKDLDPVIGSRARHEIAAGVVAAGHGIRAAGPSFEPEYTTFLPGLFAGDELGIGRHAIFRGRVVWDRENPSR